MLRYIVERYGAPLRVEPSPVGLTPLQEAARLGCLQVVRYVLQAQGVDHAAINHRSPSTGCSALSDAAMRGHAGVVSLLLAAGAQVDAPRKDGKTALHCAAEQGHAAVVRQLLRAGADPLAREEEGRTPAELAEVWHEDARAFLLAAEEHQGQS
ncbi:ankyrin repeat protein [Emiliania huxleyi CCMP1516]|uniref:Ankyrin repeat protein n=4 Tax=Emiliania huxleyi TaxID=2903 RepID=A0A0D3IFM3_EMIH1|nr:ankyrin repeat protein [Emiliania huxleyi CCMP1516]EOD10058.1 ankyrin repeat protein [Emiliania huxleyi CCMP1516]|eukprot:XP_005762487.1 ankyrin repeat protein [Emiliania huxleyi CCMP1516]